MTRLREFGHNLMRVTRTPSPEIPIALRSVGHVRLMPKHNNSSKVIDFVQVIWGIAGYGAVVINGVERILHPDQIAIYFPGMVHHLYFKDVSWEYRWWTMDGPMAGPITAAFGLEADVYDVGPAPVCLFRQLYAALRDPSKKGELYGSTIVFRLLTTAVSMIKHKASDTVVAAAIEKIHREWNHRELNVQTLADHFRLNRSCLSRRFHQALGISPVKYIARLRIQNALSLLNHSHRSVAEIAAHCGYDNPHYFSRLIRRVTGSSPRKIRQN